MVGKPLAIKGQLYLLQNTHTRVDLRCPNPCYLRANDNYIIYMKQLTKQIETLQTKTKPEMEQTIPR